MFKMRMITMKFPKRVNKCLCCIKLETGGLILGWFNLISYIITILLTIAVIITLSVIGCDGIVDAFKSNGANTTELECDFCSHGDGVLIAFLVIFVLMLLVFVWVAYSLIKGIKIRKSRKLKPYLIMTLISIICSIFGLFKNSLDGFVGAVIDIVLYGYIFICVISLFKMFKAEEKEHAERYAPADGKA